MPSRFARFLLIVLALLPIVAPAAADAPKPRGKAKHVVIVVMDGLRRDTVTDAQMPTLAALAKSGTFFDAHHPVYPSSTQVNCTALATGQRPRTSDIVSNREYRPVLELLRPIDTNDPYYAWHADQSAAGRPEARAAAAPVGAWLRTPTLPELARSAGLTTAVAGTKAVAYLWDRSYDNRSADQPTLFEGKSIPAATLDAIIPRQGPFPPALDWKYDVNTARDRWTVRALTDTLWAKSIPALTIVWLYEPDFSQHGTGVGSKNALAAYKSSDDRLATILAALDRHGVRDQTDVIVASDHGCSTISKKVDVADDLRKRGKLKAETSFKAPPAPGSVVVASSGGTVALYVTGASQDPAAAAAARAKLLDTVQSSDWAGVIFTRDGADGTFKLADVGADSPDAPDLLVAMRWADEPSVHGTPGTVVCDGMDPGQGMHVSLAKYDMANTLIAAGPDFRAGLVSRLPSANHDVAPTVAHLFGLTPTTPMDGRILTEALTDTPPAAPPAPTSETIRARRTLPDGTEWAQYLQVTTLENRRYYDHGNATSPVPARAKKDEKPAH